MLIRDPFRDWPLATRMPALLVASTLSAYVLALLVMGSAQRLLVFPGTFIARRAVGAVPPGFSAIAIEEGDGVHVRALWRPPAPGCGVVLSFHGNGDRPEGAAERFSRPPWPVGMGVLAVGYRGYAGSGGFPSGAALADDALIAYDRVRAMAPGSSVVVHGHSLGSWSAMNVASRREVAGVLLEAPFTSMLDAVRNAVPFVPVEAMLLDPMRSIALASSVVAPVFVLHGDRDMLVPSSQGRALAGAFTPPARFELVAGADHNGVAGSRDSVLAPMLGGRERRVPPGRP